MSVTYAAIGWNRQKKIYDFVLCGGALLYLAIFVGAGAIIHPNATAETLLIRGFGTLAFLLLHVVLCIGPLCRLDSRFLPLLYNRRHLGVTMFFFALVHGVFSVVQFHALGDVNPLVSVFVSNTRFGSVPDFPFQSLGFFALLILFLMAATSHDFWLHTLSPGVWKRLHMMVYAAYVLLVGHVVLGSLQSETSPLLAVTLGAGMALIAAVHLTAGFRERRRDAAFVDSCDLESLEEGRGKVVAVEGERVALYRHEGRVYALSNVCRHQNGPLGEGRIVDGCVTCPWHGYQYRPDTGVSPPPYDDRVETFETRVENGRVLVCRRPK